MHAVHATHAVHAMHAVLTDILGKLRDATGKTTQATTVATTPTTTTTNATSEAEAAEGKEAKRVAPPPTLVCVSKRHPASCIRAVYAMKFDSETAGLPPVLRHFGENYVQELCDKAKQLRTDCPDIAWHFIGHLQSNKCNMLLKAVPNLHMVETVDSAKLADKLAAACRTVKRTTPLRVLVQVNTSAETQKSGVTAWNDSAWRLVQHITEKCAPELQFAGLMTIGNFSAEPDDTCYRALVKCKRGVLVAAQHYLDSADKMRKTKAIEAVCQRLEALLYDDASFCMSMGMSADYELAAKLGSTNVRIGTKIFGARPPFQKKKKKK
jgi:pyridoxal phosphate enzyme (YggS family)